MCALSPPPWSSTVPWLEQENWMGDDTWLNSNYREPDVLQSFLDFSSQPVEVEIDQVKNSQTTGDNHSTVKKLYHNANERDRRKKLNSLYSTLRSLLPATEQTKKLSIPATVSRVLKYIPELQKEVERLIQRREYILQQISRKEKNISVLSQHRDSSESLLPTVTASQVDEREMLVQILTVDARASFLSTLLLNLEAYGFQLLNASVFPVGSDRVCCSLHLQVMENMTMDGSAMRERLLSLCGVNGKVVSLVNGGR